MPSPFLLNYTKLSSYQECNSCLYLWAGIGIISTVVAKKIHFPFGSKQIFLNTYLMMVGSPASRKSTAVKEAREHLRAIGYTKFSADRTSPPQFAGDLGGRSELGGIYDQNPTSEVAIFNDEIITMLGANNLDFISMLGDFWDRKEPYSYRLRDGTDVAVENICVNMLAATTPSQYHTMFPPAIQDQGFLSRLIIIHAPDRTKSFHLPQVPPQDLIDSVQDLMRRISLLEGEIKLTPEASATLKSIYLSWTGIDDGRFAFYNERRYTQLIKISCIVAISHLRLTLLAADVVFAHNLLCVTEYSMSDALGYYGKGQGSDVAEKILKILQADPAKPRNHMKLFSMVGRDVGSVNDLLRILDNLASANKVQLTAVGYTPNIQPMHGNNSTHFDAELIYDFYAKAEAV